MNTNDLIGRLSIQVEAFQEGFSILSESKSLEDLGKNFCHILRGILMTTFVNLYYKRSEENRFSVAHEQKVCTLPDLDHYISYKNYQIFDLDNKNLLIAILPRPDKSMFAVIVGPKLGNQKLIDHEKVSLQLFSQLLDGAYQTLLMRKAEKDLIFSLNNRILQMNSLIDTGIELSKSVNERKLLVLALERAVAMTNASGGMIKIKNKNKIIYRKNFPSTFLYQNTGKMEDEDSVIEASFAYRGKKYLLTLYNKESRTGLIPFDETDHLLLDALTRQAHAAIENDYLQKRALEMETVKRELAIAATIQQRILPESLPVLEGYDLAGKNIPTIEVCGDYYDCIQIDDHRYALIMADVSGKGIPAALLVSSLQASLRAYLEGYPPLPTLASKLNKLIYQSTTAEKYLTMSICYLNTKTGELETLNAGHNPPLILHSDQSITKIKIGGIPIGMADLNLPYKMQELKLEPGDNLLMFTDGITEAMDVNEEMYEDDRLEKFMIQNRLKPASDFVEELMGDVNQFVGKAAQSDDITVLYLKRNK